MAVAVVTDSTAVLPRELVAEYGVEVVPLAIAWEDRSFRDGVDLTYADFVARLSNGTPPKTSAPSPGDYHSAYERVLQRGATTVLVVTPPAELSATFSNAVLAAQTVDPERIEVLDSRSAAAGQGLVVLEAARAAREGDGLQGARGRAQGVAERVRLVATLERLDYLRRSGRVPAVAVYATDALHLHPLFRFVQGSPTPMGAARGGRRAADRMIAEWERSRPDEAARCHATVFHSSRERHAEELRDRILAAADGAETYVVEATAAMAAHLGPGVLGVAWWWQTRDG